MKTSIKLGVAATAGLLGVALAAGGAFASTGSTTARHTPGRALQDTAVVHEMGQRVTPAMPTARSTPGTTAATTAMRTSHTTAATTAMRTNRTTMMPTATSTTETSAQPTAIRTSRATMM